MNKLFSLFNFCIMLLILILGSIAHLMYGHCQTTKLHFMIQYHLMPNHLPNWMLKYDKNFDAYLTLYYSYALVDKNYSGKWSAWYKNGGKYAEGEYKDGEVNGKFISWYESGAKEYERDYKEGKQNGKTTEWDANGKKLKEQEWKDDVMIKDYLE